MGAVRRWDKDVGDAQWRKIIRRLPHPDYDSSIPPTNIKHDLMLIKIEKVTKPHLKPIELNFDDSFPTDGQNLRVIGMGMTRSNIHDNAPISYDLRLVDLTSVNTKQCRDDWEKLIQNWQASGLCASEPQLTADCLNMRVYPEEMLCVNGEERASCDGDSGGPLFDLSSPSRPKQVGVVSYGRPDCNMKKYFPLVDGPDDYFPEVFARVSANASWLKKTICNLTNTKLTMCSSCKKKGFRCRKSGNKRGGNCCGKNFVCSKLRSRDGLPRCQRCHKATKPCGPGQSPCCSGLKCKKQSVRKGKVLRKCADINQ